MLTLALAVALQAYVPVQDARRAELLAAEDARAVAAAQLEVLVRAASDPDTLLQRVAVRALGRLERAELLARLEPGLAAASASVRIEAANAVAQAAYRQGAAEAWRMLRGRLALERVPAVRGALLAAAGRLAHDVDGVLALEPLLVAGVTAPDGDTRAGALRGLYDLWRRQNRGRVAGEGAVEALRLVLRRDPSDAARRLAMMALATTGRLDSLTLVQAARDADPQVRTLALQATRTQRALPARAAVTALGLLDSIVMVRLEAIRAAATSGIREELGCAPLVAALEDPAVPVQLLAIDGLAQGCPPVAPPAELLDRIALEPLDEASWHRPARALVALAGVDTARAAIRVGRFAESPLWWARAAAARAAARLRDGALLRRLLEDPVDNVREAALTALASGDSAAARRGAIGQLARSDFQLLLTAARILQRNRPDPEVARTAGDALARLTALRAETSRDTRLALLDLIGETAAASDAPGLRPLLQDFDPEVAARAATVIGTLTGEPAEAAPHPLPREPLHAPGELRRMTAATIHMADGGRIVLQLHPESAPANVSRFVAMARAGWFDGLTFHRVVPNFVVQGGSPGANEYSGAAGFSRDEVGGSHRRGTVGISTRGRDTGDGQIFINLVDNFRLDHEYTVIGAVVAGWEALDRMLEGARILRVEVPVASP